MPLGDTFPNFVEGYIHQENAIRAMILKEQKTCLQAFLSG